MNRLWFALLTLLLIASACKNDDEVVLWGDWSREGDFSGPPRAAASTFSIDGTPYICLGYSSGSASKSGMTDLWKYDVDNGNWVEMARFPGPPRSNATAFTIGSKAYVGLGQSAGLPYDDFYEYDPATNSWRQVASFLGGKRYLAVGVGLGEHGYVGTGTDDNLMIYNDFYKYTPNAGEGTWSLMTGYSGTKRKGATTFVVNDKIYLFGGYNNNSPSYDFHSFDPATGKWEKLHDIRNATDQSFDDDYGNLARQNASAFVIGSRAHIALGDNNGQVNTSTYEYNAINDQWIKRTAWEGAPRSNAVGFYFANRGFVATGGVPAASTSSGYFDDVWEFRPDINRIDNN